ncbi:Maf family protein [Cognatishimia activa]|uniref:Nucleoside triphosphate pyrophosphatase n=1 Tax=Cognatishimia activa TaxID=1715691 RepID=A0A0P1ILR4_9RHOB|nr:Maf family nucleotide pyrophosphatase [Cognatishimia activa]CUI41288.1 Septum formation protein Maf [Cognatishimia activa]CUK24573.1 Septum formation protein Maf [Cognatishimia activa]
MSQPLILASGSKIRADLLRNANVAFEVLTAPVDEEMIRQSLEAEGTRPRDIADSLAEAKAQRVSAKVPGALVLGCDQVLDFEGEVFAKPQSQEDARAQLQRLRNNSHSLLSAAVIYEDNKPIWRHVGIVRLRMRDFTDDFLDAYIERNWEEIRHTVGCYQLEAEGVRLFTRVDGDYFTVLGMPLLEILAYLTLRGDLQR